MATPIISAIHWQNCFVGTIYHMDVVGSWSPHCRSIVCALLLKPLPQPFYEKSSLFMLLLSQGDQCMLFNYHLS